MCQRTDVLLSLAPPLLQRQPFPLILYPYAAQAHRAAKEALAFQEASMAAAAAAVSGEVPAEAPLLSREKVRPSWAPGRDILLQDASWSAKTIIENLFFSQWTSGDSWILRGGRWF